MTDDDWSVRIGPREIYDAVTGLRHRLDENMRLNDTKLATLDVRMSTVESETAAMHARMETHDTHRTQLRWMVYAALIGVLGAILTALIPLLLRH